MPWCGRRSPAERSPTTTSTCSPRPARPGRRSRRGRAGRLATDKRYAAFRRKVRYWSDQVDPDGTDQRACDQQAAAEWHASTSFQDEVFVNGRLDPVGGSIYERELERLTDWLFEQEWAEATARLGEGNVRVTDSPAPRRAPRRRPGPDGGAPGAMALGRRDRHPAGAERGQMDWATFCAELARPKAAPMSGSPASGRAGSTTAPSSPLHRRVARPRREPADSCSTPTACRWTSARPNGLHGPLRTAVQSPTTGALTPPAATSLLALPDRPPSSRSPTAAPLTQRERRPQMRPPQPLERTPRRRDPPPPTLATRPPRPHHRPTHPGGGLVYARAQRSIRLGTAAP